jgi:alpha-D-ribose 1-methylphosphonate 5-phosphate C-P lyase
MLKFDGVYQKAFNLNALQRYITQREKRIGCIPPYKNMAKHDLNFN